MLGKKIKAFAAISICCCLLTTQIALADTTIVTSETKAIEVPAEPVKKDIKTKISLDDAKKIVKGFKFTEGFEINNVYLENDNGTSQPAWRMDLSSSDYTSNMNVTISANTGVLFNYNFWQGGYNRKNVVTITKKQAKEAADKFIKEYVEINGKTLELVPETNIAYEKVSGIYEMPQYNFNYAMKVNGILVSDTTYYISVNAVNGKISSFYSPYGYTTETKYPSTEGVQDKTVLRNKYAELLQMQLTYMINWDNNNPKAYLAYVPAGPGVLDAKTMKTSKEIYDYYGNGYAQTMKNKPIVPGFKVGNKEITEEEAEKTVLKIKTHLEKVTGVKFNDNSNTYIPVSSTRKEIAKNYYFSAAENRNINLSISISLSTGNITNLSFYQFDMVKSDKKPTINEKVKYTDAKKTSDEIVKNLFEKQYGIFSDNNEELQASVPYLKDQPTHQFSYTRIEHEIFTNNSINVSIDKETGKPTQIYFYWNDMEFPEPKNVISADKAKELYLKDANFELTYFTPYDYKDGMPVKRSESLIVYKPDNQTSMRYIDAEKGIVIDYAGRPLQQKYKNENHWAAVNIEMLETQGVVLNNITDYDAVLTRRDAVKMLSLVRGVQYYSVENVKGSFADVSKDDEYFRYIETAVDNDIIKASGKNFNGKANITKQEFIEMLLNVLGYQEIINHPELFVKTDSDIRISICRVLDILPVKPGATFNASDNITFAEAAYSLQKALKYLR